MYFKKSKMSIMETKRMENMYADLERQKALTGYVAMMTDVELPNEEQEVIENGE